MDFSGNLLLSKGVFFGLLVFCVLLFVLAVFFLLKIEKMKALPIDLNKQIAFQKAERENDRVIFRRESEEKVAKVVKRYKRFDQVIDAEIFALNLKSDAEAFATNLRSEAEAFTANLRTEAETYHLSRLGSANGVLASAKKVLVKAEEDANLIRQESELHKQALGSIKNQIEGYGDEYLVPNQDLLDELADDFSHQDAGLKLKSARECIKTMLKLGSAADCAYVEEHRRQTAIKFVLDAFNGKVTAILSKVRIDNFGKLEAQIRDAFNLVNYHGQAFRDARVTTSYLAVRIDELKWAVRVYELKKIEQEEQREIRETMREEARAQREYDKALKDAYKEEKLLQQAMEKAKRHFDTASEAEKQKYQLELDDLQGQLKLAEEKNQRALSMAQQTRTGHVYVISNVGSFGEEIFKIGMTRRLEPMDRVKELGDASVPFPFDVHAMIKSEDAPKLEKELHEKFARSKVNKVNPRKEFFNVSLGQVRSVIDELGINACWTMAADAYEYKQGLASSKEGFSVCNLD